MPKIKIIAHVFISYIGTQQHLTVTINLYNHSKNVIIHEVLFKRIIQYKLKKLLACTRNDMSSYYQIFPLNW